jgi:hypothetical protein
MMVVLASVNRVNDTVGGAVQTVAEGVVLAFVVVVSHVRAVVSAGVFSLFKCYSLTLSEAVCWVLARVRARVLPPTRLSVLFGERCGAVTVVSLGYVDVGIDVDLSAGSVTSPVFTVVDAVLNVDLGVGVTTVRLTVSAEAGVRLAVVTCLA